MRPLRLPLSRWFPTLAAQLTAVGLFACTTLAVTLLLIFRFYWIAAQEESSSDTLRSIAADIATEAQPFLDPIVDELRLNRVMHSFLLYNRSIDIYIVDAEGLIRNSFCQDGCGNAAPKISPASLKATTTTAYSMPLEGDDPRNSGTSTRVSVAPVTVTGQRHFLYVVLFNRSAVHLTHILQGPVAFRTVAPLVALVTLLVSLIFRLFVRRSMKPFSSIMTAVQTIRQGEYAVAVPTSGTGELALLGSAIHEMAATIADNVVSLRENDRVRRELIANIWHDIRTPVTGISSLLQRYERVDEANHSEGRDFIARMRANVELLTRFLSDISELGKLDTGEIKPKIERCGIVTLLEDVSVLFSGAAEERHIALTVEANDDLPTVRADSAMITRAVSNLVQNAIRYTPPSGSIVLGAIEEGCGVTIFVRDTGSGIEPNDLPRIFERTFQSKTEFEHGVGGLGLAIVKSIVESHQSCVKVTSTLGAGTEFRFSLPISNEPPPPS